MLTASLRSILKKHVQTETLSIKEHSTVTLLVEPSKAVQMSPLTPVPDS